MIELLYIPIILFLYLRTWRYYYLIDDPVPRDGYLYELPRKVGPEWYDRRRPLLATVTNIGVFMASCGYIHYLFGWKAALLYAVMPLNVSGVAWNTGNYYMSSVLLVLGVWMFLSLKTWAGAGVSAALYAAALNSTLSSVPFMAAALFFPYGWVMGIPFLTFIFGKRLRVGLGKRKARHDEMGIEVGRFRISNLLNVPKTLAYYLYLSFFPLRLGFFHTFGKQNWYSKPWFTAASCLVCITAVIAGYMVNPFYTLCWFLFMGIFSQFIVYGQHVSERYTFLANVFFCALVSAAVADERLLWVIAALWFCKSLEYVKAFKDDATLFSYSVTQFPDCPENYVNLGSYYISRGNWFNAIKPMLMAEKLTIGNRFGVYMNLANCYGRSGMYGKAMEYTLKAVDTAPKDQLEGLLAQRDEIHNRITALEHNKKKLKKMGVI